MIVICLRCASSLGQTPASVNVQVGHDSWTFKEGAPADVACLAQTNDGFLWLGGPNGLFRFDGTRFEPFSSSFGDRLLSSDLYSLFAPPSGGLKIGYTLGGFSFMDKGRVTNYASETGSVYGFTQDRDGIVWAGASSGLWRFDHSGWQHIGVEWNAPAGRFINVGFDSEGILWALVGGLGAPKDLIYLIPGTRHFKTAGSNLSVSGFTWEPDRTVLTAPLAPRVFDSGEGPDERPPAYPVTKKDLQMVDRNNSVWISPSDKPVVMRLPKDSLRDVENKQSPAISETYNINPFEMAELVDREGNIWFGDTRGIHRFFYTPLIRQEFPKETSGSGDFAVVADDNGAVWISGGASFKGDLYHVLGGKAERRLPQVTGSFAYRAPDKTFWFSGERCLWHLVGHDFVRVDLPPEMANQFNFLQTITGDQQGGIWISFGRHGLYRLANGSWTPYGGRDDLPKTGILISEFTDSLGRVWFGYAKSQLAVLDGDRVRRFGPSDDLQVGNISAIYGRRGPEVWIGGEFGLEQFDQGRFHKIAAVDDKWLRGISGIVETANGDLWLNAVSGIFHIRKAEISEALKDSAYRVKGEHFGRREELSGVANQLRPLPTAIEGTDGRLWFTLRNGAVSLDPAAYSEKRSMPAPITIQSVSADDKGYAPDAHLSLPAQTSSVQISYAAVSLSDPEAIRFRYKLQETDKDWHEAAAATSVTYRNLPPGSYHFSVEASDTNGVWSGAPANMAFTILPAFYQTNWFRLLCVAAFLALLWGLYQLRVQQVRQEERKFREAFETIPAMAWIAGPNDDIHFLNRRWVDYTGLSQVENSKGIRKVAIHPDDLDRIERRLAEHIASGEPIEEELRFRRTDGEYRWFLARVVPLRDKRGKIVKWYGTATDIQDRKRAEELQADLAHTNRVSMLGELAASISHELKQPIAASMANAQASLRWLKREQPDLDQACRSTEAIVKDGRLAADIIDRLRSLYKKTPPQRESVDVCEVVSEMILLLRSEANEHAVSIRTDLAADLPKITADPVQLQQVLMNLMLNGIEAMKETGGVLTVKTGRGECGQVLISVSDTGVGLPAGKADEIFNAFFTTKPQGSGMGLAISRSIVESHGGRIWANGDSRRGATFHFTLPAAPTGNKPSRGGRVIRHSVWSLLLLLTSSLFAAGQSLSMNAASAPQSSQPSQVKQETDELRQQLDIDAAALSKIPADPLIRPDPLAPIFQPVDKLSDRIAQSARLKFGATYTFLNQYATITPDGVRHNQLSGRLDFTGAWRVYDHGSTAGSISLLVRSGTNIGISQQFNLSDSLGSGLYLNCLQGGGPQEPITLNILYWRQDFLKKRLSFYVGKIHPNEFVTLSMFNNDERTQFLNGANDGNLAVAYDGTYAGGGAVEFQATRHVYIHAIAVDTEGGQQRNIDTLVDRKYAEGVELGWTSGSLGEQYRHYRVGMWRDDTKNSGSGYGGGFGFDHEFHNGWTPFGRVALSTSTGTAIKQIEGVGLAKVHPFGRRRDLFAMAFNYSVASHGKHRESVFESFYRLRLTQSINIGPDLEVSIHPTYATKAYTTALLGARMEIIF